MVKFYAALSQSLGFPERDAKEPHLKWAASWLFVQALQSRSCLKEVYMSL